MQATRANLSQVFGLFPDADNEVQDLLDKAIAGTTPVEAVDHLGITHRVWPMSDINVIANVGALMAPKSVFIADGHHRYETACEYRDRRSADESLSADHAVNYCLMMCVGMSDPGMIVLPTHRLFRGLQAVSASELQSRLAPFFDVQVVGEGPGTAETVWKRIDSSKRQDQIGLFAGKDQRWLLATMENAGRERMGQVAAERSDEWRSLGVSILEKLILADILGVVDLPKPMYVHSVDEVVENLQSGDVSGRDATGQQGTGGDFPLAALVMPASLEHIRLVSQHGERMPAKSTYFYPKLLSGLVFNSLE